MIRKYLYYFIKKSSEKSHREYYRKYYAKEIEEYGNCTDKKSASVIKREMAGLKKYWGTYPYQYYRYRLYRKDCQLTWSELCDYIPDFFAYYIFYPRSFKERNVLCEDKRLFSAICRGYDISQPRLLFAINEGVMTDSDGKVVTPKTIVESLSKEQSPKLFFKPSYGVGGRGIFVFVKQGEEYLNASDGSILSEGFIASLASYAYIVQQGLVQSPVLDRLYAGAINTFRVVTRCRKGRVEVLFSLLRLGQSGSHVDNASVGGMYIRVDTQSGVLADYAISMDGKRLDRHPDTEVVFAGFRLPFWKEIIDFAAHLSLCFGEIEYLGWDIAYTVDGPSVVEANNGPGVSIVQDCYGGIRKAFEIDDPKRFWFSEKYALKDL